MHQCAVTGVLTKTIVGVGCFVRRLFLSPGFVSPGIFFAAPAKFKSSTRFILASVQLYHAIIFFAAPALKADREFMQHAYIATQMYLAKLLRSAGYVD